MRKAAESRRWRAVAAVAALAAAGAAPLLPVAARGNTSTGPTTRVSVSTDGAQARGGPELYHDEIWPSGDGRYVAFRSNADTLVSGDTNQIDDVFVFDRVTRTTTRVSVATDGTQTHSFSWQPSLSADGRSVAFVAYDPLTPATSNRGGIFLRDLPGGSLRQVAPGGLWTTVRPAVSATGRYVAFWSEEGGLVPGDTNGGLDVFRRDMDTDQIVRISVTSEGAQSAFHDDQPDVPPAITPDGRFVAFVSASPDLVPADTNGRVDVFVRDVQQGTTTRVNVTPTGGQSAGDEFFVDWHLAVGISDDGRFVTFASTAPDLVPGDTSGTADSEGRDVFVRDLHGGVTTRVSVATGGGQVSPPFWGNELPSISADGRYVAFRSDATGLVPGDIGDQDIFVHDRTTGETRLVSKPATGELVENGASSGRISASGNVVTFADYNDTLLPADTNRDPDVFAVDRLTGAVDRVVNPDGTQLDSFTGALDPSMSADGRFVAFSSGSDLVPGDTNERPDVFLRDRLLGVTRRASVASDGGQADHFGPHADEGSRAPAISADGRYVAFSSTATDLVPGDTNQAEDVFVHDFITGTTQRLSGNQLYEGGFKPAISADGRFVAFSTRAALVPNDTNGDDDVYVWDGQSGALTIASLRNDGSLASNGRGPGSTSAALSADGRFVAFQSGADGLVAGVSDGPERVYVRDRVAGTTRLVSVAPGGPLPTVASRHPAISADGRFVAFASSATELLLGPMTSTSS